MYDAPLFVCPQSGIVITMVADDSALESVTLRKDGILEHLGPGGIHIAMSTVSPAIARRMATLHAQHGCAYVAAPVFGRPEAAMANVVKLCGNFLIGSAMEAMSEAFTLAEKRSTPVGFEMRLALKDMNLLLDTAEQATMAMPFGSLVHNRLLTGIAKGRGTMDWTALAQLVAEDAGID